MEPVVSAWALELVPVALAVAPPAATPAQDCPGRMRGAVQDTEEGARAAVEAVARPASRAFDQVGARVAVLELARVLTSTMIVETSSVGAYAATVTVARPTERLFAELGALVVTEAVARPTATDRAGEGV